MRDFFKRGIRTAPVAVDRFGALTAKEIEALAAVPWDDGMLRVTVHLIRARKMEAVARIAAARKEGLTDQQLRSLCGMLETAEQLEADVVGVVEIAQAARARLTGG